MNQYPSLDNIARRKNQTLANVLSTRALNISFRRGREVEVGSGCKDSECGVKVTKMITLFGA
jgi:hypothetical protein